MLKSDHALDDLLTAANLACSTYLYHQQQLDQSDKHTELMAAIQTIFTEKKRRYGYRCVLEELRNQGWQINHKLVYKLMNRVGLQSKAKARKKYNSYQGALSHIVDSILDRNFTPNMPNTAWISDITEFRVVGTKVYLFIADYGSI